MKLYRTIVALVLMFPTIGNAHMAETGMRYSTFCCDDRDCKSLKKWNKNKNTIYKLEETDGGYKVTVNGSQFGEVIPYDSKNILKSTDGEIHICLVNGFVDDYEKVRCIYLPESFV